MDAKTLAAWTALVAALSGAVELRVQVGAMRDRLDRIEKLVDRVVEERPRYASSAD
jgi:hypothetical protein